MTCEVVPAVLLLEAWVGLLCGSELVPCNTGPVIGTPELESGFSRGSGMIGRDTMPARLLLLPFNADRSGKDERGLGLSPRGLWLSNIISDGESATVTRRRGACCGASVGGISLSLRLGDGG